MATAAEAKKLSEQDPFKYHVGFGNHFASEALPDALPFGQNSPQECPYGLYAEQLSGTAFTVPRERNQRSWLYRILPSAKHGPFKKIDSGLFCSPCTEVTPSQLRWSPLDLPSAEGVDWVQGLRTVGQSGDPSTKTGFAVHLYSANASMKNKAFYDSDGDMLIVPQQGTLILQTEMGFMYVPPGQICVVQRGIKFSVSLPDGAARGYVCEVFSGHFTIPSLGPIGANGLANPRDFLTPMAAFEDREGSFEIVNKFLGEVFSFQQNHSPFDVVAWHGNYAPFKYDLALFNCINSVTFDHPDPSIYTVLTCPTVEPGVACCDFVIFPPRWSVQEHTFRPPYFHRNLMTEYMGLIRGTYEAKEGGFVPGGSSLHSCMSAHGPDRAAYERWSKAALVPEKIAVNDLAFMFESSYLMKMAPWTLETPLLQRDYWQCWNTLEKTFNPSWKKPAEADK